MRLATTVSVTLIALSSAALAQVTAPTTPAPTNNMVANSGDTQGNEAAPAPDAPVDGVDNMLSQSASPPPTEPK